MQDFSHLQAVKHDTAEFTFWGLVGEPKLTVRHSGESNKPYFNEKLKVAQRHRQRRMQMTTEMIREFRERDYDLFPKFIVVGWKGVVDANGVDVPFNRDNVTAFLRAIPEDYFEDLRSFTEDPSNFRDMPDALGTAGNSQTA